jgi:Putative Flp pilus-assembly TadE/G-like
MTATVIRPPRPRRSGRSKAGQVLVLFALAAVVVVSMVAVAVDGGYGLVQMRRAQNAADFAAVAGTSAVKGVCQGSSGAPTNATVYAAVQDVIDQNSAAVNAGWTGTYLDRNGAVITTNGSPYTVSNTNSYPPANACGVSVNVTPSWQPFLAQVMGVKNLTSTATAKAVLNPGSGQNVAIVALDQLQPHEVLGGGKGSFNVYGTIFANSTVPYGPWNQTHYGVAYDDVVDAKDTSSLTLHGIMETAGSSWPLDWCFSDSSSSSPPYNNTPPKYPPTPDPYNTATCKTGSSTTTPLSYDQIVNKQSQITDPLLPVAGTGGVPDPFDQTAGTGGWWQGLCPGENSPTTRTVPAAVNGTIVLQPGYYSSPVILTGSNNVQFADCTGSYDTTQQNTAFPGVFRFNGGLAILTSAGTTVQGNNVMIATKSPVPLPANVPGSFVNSVFTATGTGNGAPCYPTGVTNANNAGETDSGSPTCGGTTSSAPAPFNTLFTTSTSWKGVVAYNQSTYTQDTTQYGTGTNYSLILGGAGTVNLGNPSTGIYRDIALFQNRSTAGNFGLDAYPGDTANVTVNGVVYNASLPCNGMPKVNGACATTNNLPQPNPFAYWDVGIIFNVGGMLQTGVGTGTGYPKTSAGTVQINGPVVVEDFNTDGTTTIVIDGTQNTYNLPGVIGSGNPPIVG